VRAAGICAAHLRRNGGRIGGTPIARYGAHGSCAEGLFAGVHGAPGSRDEGAFAWVVRDASFGTRLQRGQIPVPLLGLSPLPPGPEAPLAPSREVVDVAERPGVGNTVPAKSRRTPWRHVAL
jgi:hypothetical protein